MRKRCCVLATTTVFVLSQFTASKAQTQSGLVQSSANHSTADKETSEPAEALKSTKIFVVMDEMIHGESSVEWFSPSDNEVSVRILKSSNPVVRIPRGFKVRRQIEHDTIVFTFLSQANLTPTVEWKSNVLEILFAPADSSVGVSKMEDGALQKSSVSRRPLTIVKKPAQELTVINDSSAKETKSGSAFVPVNTQLVTAPGTTAAQGGSPISTNPVVRDANIDLAVPESPAFTVLGLTPDTVVRPSSPQELVTSLLNGVDQNGNFQSGIALDTVPYLLLAGDRVTLADYQKNYVTRLLSRTQLSIASTKGASDSDKSSRLALGFRLTLWDDGDPRTDKVLTDCMEKGLRKAANDFAAKVVIPPNQVITPAIQTQIDAATADAKALVVACRQQSRKDNWNGSSFTIGAAPSWISMKGSVGDLMWNGGAVWASLAYGFKNIPALSKSSQLILHARYRTKEQVPDPDHQGQFFIQDSSLFGGRLRAGTPDLGFNLEGVYMHNNPEKRSSNSTYRLSFGAERRIAQDLWFNISVGGQGGRSDGKSNTFVLTSFKWNFSKDPQFGGVPPR